MRGPRGSPGPRGSLGRIEPATPVVGYPLGNRAEYPCSVRCSMRQHRQQAAQQTRLRLLRCQTRLQSRLRGFPCAWVQPCLTSGAWACLWAGSWFRAPGGGRAERSGAADAAARGGARLPPPPPGRTSSQTRLVVCRARTRLLDPIPSVSSSLFPRPTPSLPAFPPPLPATSVPALSLPRGLQATRQRKAACSRPCAVCGAVRARKVARRAVGRWRTTRGRRGRH